MTRTMWEMTLGNESVLFASEMDAASAMAALARGVTVAGAADPRNPRARVRLEPVVMSLRRVEVPVPGRRRPPASITTADGNTTTMLAAPPDAVRGLSSPIKL